MLLAEFVDRNLLLYFIIKETDWAYYDSAMNKVRDDDEQWLCPHYRFFSLEKPRFFTVSANTSIFPSLTFTLKVTFGNSKLVFQPRVPGFP